MSTATDLKHGVERGKGPSLGGFVITIGGAVFLYWFMNSLPTVAGWLPYNELAKNAAGNALYQLLWLIGDTTEAQFYKSVLGGLGLLLFAFIAWQLDVRGSKWAGFRICYGTRLWPWVLLSQSLGLFLSVVGFRYIQVLNTTDVGWIPTFVPFVSTPVAVVFVYGGSWAAALTGAVLGGLIGFPLAWWIDLHILLPTKMPLVIANVTAMWLGTIIVLEICRYLPWMRRVTAKEETPPPAAPAREETATWFIRRVLADFTEAQFYGNEWASVGIIGGTIISYMLNPAHPAYGSKLFPAILLSQVIASATGVFLYFRHWKKEGWYPTFVPVVSVAPAVVLIFGGTLPVILAGAVLGAIMGPPLAHMVIKKLPDGWHPVIGNTFSMALTTAVVVMILKWLPGFGMPL
ncbi:MAG: hypothetical protein HPY55_16180 [Firmicutes bacterium]|nr:hypothetical protein [Bacillota bacterium]